jgi:phage shock protein E
MNGKRWGKSWLVNSVLVIIIIVMIALFKGAFKSEDPELTRVLQQEDVQLIDVRSPEEFSSGTVKGAANLPLGEIEKKIDQLDRSKPIVLFCQGGNRSGHAVRMLKEKGFSEVYNGGGWRSLSALVDKL